MPLHARLLPGAAENARIAYPSDDMGPITAQARSRVRLEMGGGSFGRLFADSLVISGRKFAGLRQEMFLVFLTLQSCDVYLSPFELAPSSTLGFAISYFVPQKSHDASVCSPPHVAGALWLMFALTLLMRCATAFPLQNEKSDAGKPCPITARQDGNKWTWRTQGV